MQHRIVAVVAALMSAATVTVGATVLTTAAAGADTGAPQSGFACAEGLADALTQLPDGTFLSCRSGSWESYVGPYPTSDRWFSYGSAVTLHGQGLRNPEILSGKWVGTPQDPATTCSAEQAAVVSAGKVGPAQTSKGEQGRPLDFELLPGVFSIALTGDCLWQRVG